MKRITSKMLKKYGCAYCAKRQKLYCPYSECLYKKEYEKYRNYSDYLADNKLKGLEK